MKLEDYIKHEGIKLCKFAEKIGYSRFTLHRVLHDKKIPPKDFVKRVCEATQGKVQQEDLLEGWMLPKQKKGRRNTPPKKKAAAKILSSAAAGVPSIDGEQK